MTSGYNPDDYERILAYGGEDECEGCAFLTGCDDNRCLVVDDGRFPCCIRDHRDWVDYIYVVKNAKAE